MKLKSLKIISNTKGQNVVEYILVTVGVLIVLLAFMNTKNGPMKNAMDNILNDTVDDINHLGRELK